MNSDKLCEIIAVLGSISVSGEANMNRLLYCIQQLKEMAAGTGGDGQ